MRYTSMEDSSNKDSSIFQSNLIHTIREDYGAIVTEECKGMSRQWNHQTRDMAGGVHRPRLKDTVVTNRTSSKFGTSVATVRGLGRELWHR